MKYVVEKFHWQCGAKFRLTGVFACLLALSLAIFSHLEVPDVHADNLHVSSAVVTMAGDQIRTAHGITDNQCSHHAQCTFSALVPDESELLGKLVAGISVFVPEAERDRSIIPQPHPPKHS